MKINGREYKSRRHYVNAMLKAMGRAITGEDDDDFIHGEAAVALEKRDGVRRDPSTVSIKDLNDDEAEELYNRLSGIAKTVNFNMQTAEGIVNPPQKGDMTDGQRASIIAICLKLEYSVRHSFHQIIKIIPEAKARLSNSARRKTVIKALYDVLTKDEGDKVIKVLDKIQQNLKK